MNNHLINSRDTVIFDILKNYEESFINNLRDFDKTMKKKLMLEHINYNDLKTILSPGNKGDIAFIFDYTKIDNCLYGEYLLKLIMKKLYNDNFCFLHGDYCIYSANSQEKNIKIKELKKSLYEEYNTISDPSSLYIMYFTNIGITKAKDINNYLKEIEKSYIGFSELNLNGNFKTILSTILSQPFIKHNKNIIEPSPNTEYIEKNDCPNFLILKNYDYKFFNINSDYYNIFLEYKIPSTIKHNDKDLYYSLKYLNNDINDKIVKDLNIIITKEKISYLLKQKEYIFNKWNIKDINEIRDFLIIKIKEALALGEIFDLDFMDEYDTFKFNIYIEHLNRKYKIGLKLLIDKKELFFITLTSIDK